jgi:hypothetical protein
LRRHNQGALRTFSALEELVLDDSGKAVQVDPIKPKLKPPGIKN